MEINRSDYFNNFDPAKAYQRLLFIAGRPLQSAELNEVQDMIMDTFSKMSKYLVSNGTIISGGEITSLTLNNVSINEAVVSLEGVPTVVAQSNVSLPSTGVAIVGVALKTIMVTGNDDTAILEPDTQSPHYGGDGAYRQKAVASWKISTQVSGDEVFFPVITISEGAVLSSSSSTSDNGAIAKAIATYDDGVHGSYVVNGLTLSYSGINPDTGTVDLSMSSGVARVAGSEKSFPVETTISLDPITDSRQVLSEPIVFVAATKVYALRNSPIRNINGISGTKRITQSITRGAAAGGADLMPHTPVLIIDSVVQGGTTYVKDVDFKQTGDTIDWSLAGAEPSPGSTYNATYQYIANFAGTFSGNNVVIADVDAAALVGSTTIYVDYEFYLSRVDRILVSRQTGILISKGSPGIPSMVQAPNIPQGAFMSLATVTVAKGIDAVVTQTGTVYMVPFSTIKTMSDNIEDMKYNIAQLSLKDTAGTYDPVTTKRGVIVDSLLNENMRDAGVTQNAIIVDQKLRNASNMTKMTLNSSSSFRLDTASEYEVFSNPYQTKAQRINPYAGSGAAKQAGIELAPQALNGQAWWWWWHGTYMPRPSTTTVNLSRFSAGEVVKVYFRGVEVGSGVANVGGSLAVPITIPDRVPYGNYEVSATGQTSGAGAKAVLTLFGRADGGDFSQDYWTGGEIPIGADPVAQTFVITKDQDLSAVSIFMKELPTNTLFIKLVPVSLGIPDSGNVLAIASLGSNQVTLGWNKLTFKMPQRVYVNQEYAVIVSTSNFQGTVATARVGEYDATNGQWITNQTLNGVLLLSANERTWTPVQDEDLTMKLHAVTYAPVKSQLLLAMTDYPNNATEFNATKNIDVPAGTSAVFSLKVGSVVYDLADKGITAIPPIASVVGGSVELWMTLRTSDPNLTPKVSAGVALYAGVIDTPATYVQRTFLIPGGTTTPAKITVIVDQAVPSGGTVNVYYQKADLTWQGIPRISGTDLGNGKETVTYQATGVSLNSSKLKIDIGTSSYASRPTVENIRTLVS